MENMYKNIFNNVEKSYLHSGKPDYNKFRINKKEEII